MVRRIFGPEREEVAGDCIKSFLHASPNFIRVITSRILRWEGHKTLMEEKRNAHKALVGKPVGKGQFGRPRYRWKENIRMDLRELGRGLVSFASG
jgi:hypothetical protein